MKKFLASLVAVFALLPAQAASADILNLSAGVFPQDQFSALSSTGDPFAVGGGTDAIERHFAFSAHCKDASGECPDSGTAPSGYAVVSDPVLGEAQGHVCEARIFPPAAVFWIEVEKGSGTLGSSPVVGFVVEDNGNPGDGGLPDALLVGAATQCAGGFAGVTATVTQGNIVVKN